ncbi:MAG TPA: prepilin-type N-terminal cleavage/methylation domain-containing protein [Candidatus Magasanikbacteria bacterium]|nr:prepilin-type N-terminal cleavage/methylation domain-containing protein [Candidatus Magasanikbacteria bacterium]
MNKKGFTLVELLVVIAIIGLLSTLAVVALGTTRAKARDSKRLSDIKQVQTALEMYYTDNSAYPEGSGIVLGSADAACLNASGFGAAGCTSAYMGQVPADPGTGSYTYTQSDSTYTITGTLEGKVNNLEGTFTATPSGITSATTTP